MLRRTPALLPLLVSSCTLASCSLALGYPEPTDEGATAVTCSNGADDDLDGRVDCLDPDCDGRCEELDDRCADVRDNDGDGLSDGLDPACWTEASLRITRCAGVDGTTATLPSGATFGWNGVAERIDDGGRIYFGAATAPARIAWATPLTGRLEGSRVELGVRWGATVPAAVWLVPAASIDADLTIAPDTERVGAQLAGAGLRLFSRIERVAYAVDPRTADHEIRVAISFEATELVFEVHVGEMGAVPVRAPIPPQWGPDEPLALLFEAEPHDVPVLLRDVIVERPARTRCDREVPELTADGENVVLDASRDADGRVCVLATIEPADATTRRVRAYSGTDGSFTEVGVVETEGVVLGASIAWDDARGEWFGLIAGVDAPTTLDPSPDFVRSVRGPSCASLVVGEESGFPRVGLDAGGLDYAVLEDGRHRATFDYYGETANRFGLREGFSPDGAPGSWGDLANIDLGDAYDALRTRTDRLSIDTVGRDRLLFVVIEGDVRLYRERDDGWDVLPEPVFLIQDEPGTFDRSRISPPRLVMDDAVSADGRWRGRLWYGGSSGSGCAECGRAGSADVEVVP